MSGNHIARVLLTLIFLFAAGGIDSAHARGGVNVSGGSISETPPPQPMSPYSGVNKPYIYDVQTGRQVAYWQQVMKGLADKINSRVDNANALNDINFLWEEMQNRPTRGEARLSFTDNEAKLLCLFVTKAADEPDSDVFPNWPSPGWPSCGNVLQTMFGPNIHGFLNANADDPYRMDVYAALFMGMGIQPKFVEATINKNIQQSGIGAGDVDFADNVLAGDEICYNAANNIQAVTVGECGVLCTVTTIIVGLLEAASKAIYSATVQNDTFTSAIQAVMVLYVTIYGALVVLGLAQVTLGDALVRVAKLGVVTLLISTETPLFLFDMVRCLFIEGTTYLINQVLLVGIGSVQDLLGTGPTVTWEVTYTSGGVNICSSGVENATNGGGPLVALETLLSLIFSNHMGLTLLTLFLSSVEGAILTLFLGIGLIWFIMALISAVTIYLTSLIALYLLLSMAPIFISFLLFQRTKSLFDGWISQLATNALSPIFLFAYISLFIVVIEAALAQILDTQICWRKWMTLAWVFDIYKFQFVDLFTNVTMINATPFGFFEVMIFVILTLIMKEFEDNVTTIAGNIAGEYGSGVGNDKLSRMFKGMARKVGNTAMSRGTGAAKGAASSMAGNRARNQINSAHNRKTP